MMNQQDLELFFAVKNDDIEKIDTLLTQKNVFHFIPDVIPDVNMMANASWDKDILQDDTPLIVAARLGHVHCLKTLIRHGAQVNHPHSSPALIKAAKEGEFECVKCLIEHGARINVIDEWLHSRSALHYVCLDHSQEKGAMIHYLIENGSDLNQQDAYGCTPLMLFLKKNLSYINNIEIINMFIHKPIDLHLKNSDGETVFDIASALFMQSEIREFFADLKANIELMKIIADEPQTSDLDHEHLFGI